MMAWHVNMTWHNIGGLILCLTVPGHYWITLTIHAFKLALGKGITAPLVAVPARRVLHGLYAIWWLAPALSRALGALSHGARGTPGLHCASRRGACRLSMDSRKRQRPYPVRACIAPPAFGGSTTLSPLPIRHHRAVVCVAKWRSLVQRLGTSHNDKKCASDALAHLEAYELIDASLFGPSDLFAARFCFALTDVGPGLRSGAP